VGVWAAQDCADEQPRHPEVVGVHRRSRHLLRRVELGQAASDDAQGLDRLDERFFFYADRGASPRLLLLRFRAS